MKLENYFEETTPADTNRLRLVSATDVPPEKSGNEEKKTAEMYLQELENQIKQTQKLMIGKLGKNIADEKEIEKVAYEIALSQKYWKRMIFNRAMELVATLNFGYTDALELSKKAIAKMIKKYLSNTDIKK